MNDNLGFCQVSDAAVSLSAILRSLQWELGKSHGAATRELLACAIK
jgi:hypothetical protein